MDDPLPLAFVADVANVTVVADVIENIAGGGRNSVACAAEIVRVFERAGARLAVFWSSPGGIAVVTVIAALAPRSDRVVQAVLKNVSTELDVFCFCVSIDTFQTSTYDAGAGVGIAAFGMIVAVAFDAFAAVQGAVDFPVARQAMLQR